MTIKVRILTLIMLGLNVYNIGAQNYLLDSTISGTAIYTCGGNFYDSGGPSADYSGNENYNVTFCSLGGQAIEIDFETVDFSIQGPSSCSNDRLRIYDGSDTSAPLFGTYCGDNSPGLVTSSGSCLHITFSSNGSSHRAGWEATILCESDEICGNGLDDNNDGSIDEFCNDCGTGSLLYERWLGVSGTSVLNLTSNSNYPNNLTERGLINLYQGAYNHGDNYGTRVQGFLKPQITGLYQFTVTSDEGSEFYLSTNGDPNNKTLLASVPGWTNVNEYDKYPEQVSVEVFLTAGAHYYTELIHKEGGGGDHFQVYWTTPTNSSLAIIPGSVLSPLECCLISISQDVSICSGESTTITSTPFGDGSYSYSWSPTNGLSNSNIQNPVATPSATTTYVVTVTDSAGCTSTDDVVITVLNEITINITDQSICIGETSSVTPTSTGSGPFIYNWGTAATSGNTLTVSPTVTSTYVVTITDSNNCTNTALSQITVESLPNVALSLPNSEFCIDDAGQNLSGGSPTGGSYSGTGVSGSTFDPAEAGIGLHTITYTFTDSNGCTNVANQDIEVHSLPNVTLSLSSPSNCEDYVSYSLSGGLPLGGIYSGNGVAGGNFDPSAAGPGIHTITYTFTDGNGCADSATQDLEVYALPSVTLTLPTTTNCLDDVGYALSGGLPKGGNYSGTGVNGGVFNPSTADVGTHTIIYSYTDSNGCISQTSQDIIVYDLPTVTFSLPNNTSCVDDTNFELSGGLPTGGIYTGTGVSGNIFNASVAGAGAHTITYTYEDGNGCEDSETQVITVYSLPNVTLSLSSPSNCEDDVSYSLSGGLPLGGIYSGNGVAGGNFDPSAAGPGIHTITYTFTDGNGCVDSATQDLEVYALPSVTLTLSTTTNCLDDVGYALSGGLPIGGNYSGTGVNGGVFNPSTAGVGTHTIIYSYTDSNGCISQTSQDIIVYDLPTVTFSLPNNTSCVDDTNFELSGGLPTGGIYTGTGVSGNIFNASVAGAGAHTITYTYEDGNGCEDSETQVITVYSLPNVTLSLSSPSNCEDDVSYSLSGGLPTGGIYSGNGVAGGDFDPSAASPGIHTITYTFTDGNGCVDSATQDLEVYALPSVTLTLSTTTNCLDDVGYALSGGLPAGGSYSGTGVNGGVFNPSTAGVGTHTIIYSYMDSNGCISQTSQDIIVYDLPTVTFSLPNNTSCVDDTNFELSGGLPTGGIYTGTGVSGNIFNASVAGAGAHTITYTYEDGNGCEDSETQVITVYDLPAVSLSLTDAEVCESESTIILGGGTPSQGTYSGTGVTGDVFDVATAGVGTHSIHYTITDINGCTNTASQDIEVYGLPNVILDFSDPNACFKNRTYVLNEGTPVGGTYSGVGVIGNNFDPNSAGIGVHFITYTYTDANGCTNQDTDEIEVQNSTITNLNLPFGDLCEDVTSVTLSGGNPTGGIYSGPGVTGNIFSPNVAGIGSHTITYTFDDGYCVNVSTDQIIVIPTPEVSISLATTEICFGESIDQLSGGLPIGGTYSGIGVEDGSFNSFESGAGTFEITYSYTASNGCEDVATQNIIVHDLPNVELDIPDTITCVIETTHLLEGGLPSGGSYSGPGVIDNNFDASLAGIGNHEISYIYTDVNGCIAEANDIITVLDIPNPSLDLPVKVLCEDEIITLSGESPEGGIWEGPGVIGNEFNASLAGPGTHTINYYFELSECTSSISDVITVYALPEVSIASSSAQLCYGESLTLPSATPSGGDWSGEGVIGDEFDSTYSGEGIFEITYTYINSNGCMNAATFEVEVFSEPLVGLELAIEEICEDASSFELTGGTPLGGTYSGTGVVGNNFDPSVAGVGIHIITYDMVDENGCPQTAVDQLEVIALPNASLDLVNFEVCPGMGVQTLAGGWPLGGTYSGTAVTGNQFDPDIAGTGIHTITYTVSVNGCTSSATDVFEVFGVNSIELELTETETCIGDDIILESNAPSGGNYSGVGVNPWSGTFSTVVAGVGTHSIYYDYVDENGCLVELFDEIIVYDVLPATLLLETNLVCATESNIPLSGGSPAGGTWSGPGVTVNTFDPLSVGAGVYTITYTYEDANGCSAVAIDEIVVESAPIVTYTYEDDHCNLSNGSITFQFQDQIDVSIIEFSLNNGINWMSPIADNLGSITYANLSAGIYELVVRNSSGACEIDLETITINNIAGPDADAGPDVTIAASASTQLSGSGGNFYSWTPSIGLSNTNIANPIASPTETTTYTLEVTDIYGCTDTDQITVTVDVPCAGTVSEGGFPYVESFESDLGIWSQDQTDDFDWIRDNANPEGPASGSQGSWYMLAVGSGNSDQTSIFRSPCFDLENESCAQFTFDYYIANSGSLTLEASNDFGNNWLEIWNVSANQGISWNTQVVDLFGYLNSNLQLRFVADMGSVSSGSMGIDNVEFITTGCGCADTSSPFIDFSLVPDPQPFSVDIDCDGDADVLSGGDEQLFFFENNGDGTYTDQTGTGQDIMPALSFLDMTIGLVDLDNDGDKDMSIVGNEAFNKYFFWNIGSKTNPVFIEAGTGGTPANPIANFNFNPLDGGIYIGYADPTIFWADLDNDNDFDAVVGGKLGWFQYYENIGDENSPNLVLRTGGANPFDGLRVDGADEGNGLMQYESSPFLVDWDGDGDLDMFSGNQISTVQYFENVGTASNPIFVERTGSANPFDGVIFSEDSHLSIVDEDCDGDWDVFYGVGDTTDDAEITMCDLLVAVPNFAQAGSNQSHYCIGDPIFLSELSHVGVLWSWIGPNGFTSTEQNPIIQNGSMANEGVYTVTITNEQGCVSTSSTTITLSETIADAGPDSTIDLGDQTQNSGGGNGVTVYWTPATGLSNPNVLNPIANPTATTTYTLTVIDQFGCVATDQMTIYVVGTECNYEEEIFHSDFETTTGDNYWTLINNATDGNFIIGQPSPYIQSGVTVMEINAQEGDQSMITGNATNYTQDLDGGPSIARSINIELPNNANSISMNLFWYLAHYVNGNSTDYLTIDIRDASNNNVLETLVDENGDATDRDAEWTLANVDLSAYAGKTIYIYINAADIGNGSKLEVGIDNISIIGTFLTVADIVLMDNDVCDLDSPITLTGGTPTGGIYSGPGVDGNIFDPSQAGPGIHTISYEYEEIDGCIAVAVEDIEVYQSPLAEIDLSVAEACINQPVVGLFGGTPTGGVWSGEGVNGSSFYPPEAGIGAHTISYTVSDENGCEISVTDEFIVYAVPIVTDITKVDAYCNLDNGSITITFDDVTDIDNIQFSINGGFGWETAIPDTDGQVTYDNLPSGTYDIWVQDVDGNCPYQLELVFIEDQIGPILDLGPDVNKCILEIASINPIVEFGLAPLTYAWAGPNDYSSDQLSVDLVEAGSYVLLVTDSNNCTASDTIEINNFSLSVDANIIPDACFGDSNGRILASANGTNPFTYTLVGFGTNGSGVFNNLSQGNYQLEVEDAYGCIITQGFNVPGPPSLVCSQDSCVRSLSTTWVGIANGPFTSTSGTNEISLNVVNDENTDVSNFSIDEFLTTTDPNWFVENAEGIASLRLQTVWDTDSEYPSSDIDDVDDKETITFTFNFDKPVNDVVLHIDELGDFGTEGTTTWSNSSEWTLVDAGLSLSKLSGTNDLQVKTNSFFRSADVLHDMQDDAQLPSGEGSAAGSIAINSPSPITSFTFTVTGIGVEGLGYDEVELAISSTVCYDSEPTDYHCDGTAGVASISALGGVHPHSYKWDNGETTQTAIDLLPGEHTVTITDANGCEIECSVTIEDSSIEIDAGPNQSFCTGESGVLTPAVIEGLAPFQYAWLGPGGFDSTEQNPTITLGGYYNLTVTDANGCTDTDQVRVYEYVCDQTSNCYYLHEFNNFSYYGSEGSLDWSNYGWDETGDNNSAISGDIVINNGELSMQNTDSTPPSIKRQLDLSGHTSGVLSFDFSVVGALTSDDQFDVEIFDGTDWHTIFSFTSGSAGTQTPWLDISAYLSANTEIRFSIISGFADFGEELLIDNVRVDLDCLCENNSDAGIDLEICEGDSIQLMGAGSGTYAWTPVEFLSDATLADPVAFPDETTTFILTVTDEFGCEDTDDMTIVVNESVIADAIPLSHDYCHDGSGAATVIISVGTGPFTIDWQSTSSEEQGSTIQSTIGSSNIDNLNGNTVYCIQVTDSNGCSIILP